jgi:hypothetical protein
MALTPTELQEAENEAKELWAEVQNGTLPLEEVEPVRVQFIVALLERFFAADSSLEHFSI